MVVLLLENIEQKLENIVRIRKIPPWAVFLMGKNCIEKGTRFACLFRFYLL